MDKNYLISMATVATLFGSGGYLASEYGFEAHAGKEIVYTVDCEVDLSVGASTTFESFIVNQFCDSVAAGSDMAAEDCTVDTFKNHECTKVCWRQTGWEDPEETIPVLGWRAINKVPVIGTWQVGAPE